MARGRCGRGGPIASLCELRGTAPDERSHRTKRGHIEAIVHPSPTLLPLQKPGLHQLLQVMGKGRLGNSQSRWKVAGARCGVW